MRLLLRVCLVAALLLPLIAHAGFFSPRFRGTVIDDNGVPLTDVLVVAQWYRCAGFGHCNTFCVRSDVARTDANGRYSVSGNSDVPIIRLYRSGYSNPETVKPNSDEESTRRAGNELWFKFARSNETPPERLSELSKLSGFIHCSSRDPNGERLVGAYRQILSEVLQYRDEKNYRQTLIRVCQALGYQAVQHGSSRVSDPSEEVMANYLRSQLPECAPAAITYKDRERFGYYVMQNNIEEMRKLVAAGLDPNEAYATGMSALAAAVQYGRHDSARLLLEMGVDPNKRDSDGQTPLFNAVWEEQRDHELAEKMVSLLLASGATVDVVDNERRTPLVMAIKNRHYPAARTLVRHGADVNHIDKGRAMTPLMHVTEFNTGKDGVEMIEFLLANGAKIDQADQNGETALHRALRNRGVGPIRALVRAGANIDFVCRLKPPENNLRNCRYYGSLPLREFDENGRVRHYKLAELLEELGRPITR